MPQVKSLQQKKASLWSGQYSYIKESKHYIDIDPRDRPFRSQPYRAGPKKLELVAEYIRLMLAAKFI